MQHKSGFWILSLIFLNSYCLAQNEKIVSVQLITSLDQLSVKNENRIALAVSVYSPWHINGHEPADKFLIPTRIEFDEVKGLQFTEIQYPAAQEKTFNFSEIPLLVYLETVYIFSSVSVSSQFAGKKITISGKLTYQACNDQVCLPPEKLEFKMETRVAGRRPGVSSYININCLVLPNNAWCNTIV